jgi:hypothetical protein
MIGLESKMLCSANVSRIDLPRERTVSNSLLAVVNHAVGLIAYRAKVWKNTGKEKGEREAI